MVSEADIYEKRMLEALEEAKSFNESEVIKKSLNYTLQNDEAPTDYAEWEDGSERFAKENFAVVSEWVH
jgi:hypothetical protein